VKKHLSILVIVLAVMAICASSVSAAPAETKSVSLVSVEYGNSGIVLKFETSGLKRADLKDAAFYAASNHQPIHCNFVDDTSVVRCVVSTALAGQGDFHVTLAGFGFWDTLPKSTDCADDEMLWFEYNVTFEGEVYSDVVPARIWHDAKVNGFFDIAAENGVFFEQTGRFCGQAFDEIPV
jgi:hypothetical protein